MTDLLHRLRQLDAEATPVLVDGNVDPIDMGTTAGAMAEFMERLDRWLELRQPLIASAAAHKRRDVQEQEALFRLGNAAALFGWHLKHALNNLPQIIAALERVEESAS